MGQKQKARDIVDATYQLTSTTALPAAEVLAAARQAAEASKRGFGAGIRHHGEASRGGTTEASYSVRGPGGLVSLMDFRVLAEPLASGSTQVQVIVDDFLFTKGTLGMKPTINAKSTMLMFLNALKSAL